jgi:hypothetical protein
VPFGSPPEESSQDATVDIKRAGVSKGNGITVLT